MCFLIPVLVGLISAILGYLLGKMTAGGNDLYLKSKLEASEKEIETLNNKVFLLEKDRNTTPLGFASSNTELKNCQEQNLKLEEEIKIYKEKSIQLASQLKELKTNSSLDSLGFATNISDIPFDEEAAFAAFGKKIVENDLKIIEGIGPKIEELYHNAGINTWKQLAQTPVSTSKQILEDAGSRYAIHNPETWAKQALMAYERKWLELKEYQAALHGGKE